MALRDVRIHVAGALALAFFTFGVYSVVWTVTRYKHTSEAAGRPHQAGQWAWWLGGLWVVSMVATVFFYIWYIGWVFDGGFDQTGAEALQGIGRVLLWTLVLGVVGISFTILVAILVYRIAQNNETLLAGTGRNATMPPLLTAILIPFIGIWLYVAIGILQSEINGLADADTATFNPPAAPGGPQ